MLWWTLPIFLIVAMTVDYLLSRNKSILTGTLEQKLSVILLAPIVAPVIEELAFRWMFLQWFGWQGMLIATLAWVMFHFKLKYLPFYFIMGAYFCYLWYIGLGWLAILIHVLWNTTTCLIAVKREPILANYNFRSPSLISVAWNSKEIGMYKRWIKKVKRYDRPRIK